MIKGEIDPCFVVAVSGGSDSLALLLLLHVCSNRLNYKIIVVTVDHCLRESSKNDCEFVKDLCYNLGLECHVLTWFHSGIHKNIMESARVARYKLLTDFCHKLDILSICVGHHMEDSVENFFLRLAKSAGVFGLSMLEVSFLHNIRIIRPLLNFSKKECLDYLRCLGMMWIEDSTNKNTYFTRNKLRCALGSTFDKSFGEGRFSNNVFNTQKHIYSVSRIVQDSIIHAIAESVFISDLGYATILIDSFRVVSLEIQYLIFSYLLTLIRGSNKPTRFQNVKLALNNLLTNKNRVLHLNGCRIVKTNTHILIYRFFDDNHNISSLVMNNIRWDGRFLIRSFANSGNRYTMERMSVFDLEIITFDIKNLGFEDNFNNSDFINVILSLPVVKNRGKLLCVPSIAWFDKDNLPCSVDSISVVFTSAFISSLVHF